MRCGAIVLRWSYFVYPALSQELALTRPINSKSSDAVFRLRLRFAFLHPGGTQDSHAEGGQNGLRETARSR
jgi:hypothetical protein